MFCVWVSLVLGLSDSHGFECSLMWLCKLGNACAVSPGDGVQKHVTLLAHKYSHIHSYSSSESSTISVQSRYKHSIGAVKENDKLANAPDRAVCRATKA